MISATGTEAVVMLEKGSVFFFRAYSICCHKSYSTHHANGIVVHRWVENDQ